MKKKPEALEVADELYAEYRGFRGIETKAAVLLHRQHKEIERMRELLNRLEYSSDGHIKRYPEEEEVNAALRGDKT